MFQTYYLIRSRVDGNYLTARINSTEQFLLVFKEEFEALTYLNTHAPDLSDRFMIDSIADNHLPDLLKRWGFKGIGIVLDPLLASIDFFHI